MQTQHGGAAIEEQESSSDVVGEIVDDVTALATEPPQGTSVRANEEEVEAGERAQDGEARNSGSADAGSEEEKSSDEHGASHVGHVEQDSWEDEQKQAPGEHKGGKSQEVSEALAVRTLMRAQATPSRSRTNAPAATGEAGKPHQGAIASALR